MLPKASASACNREDRVQEAFSGDHHGLEDATAKELAIREYHAEFDYVLPEHAV